MMRVQIHESTDACTLFVEGEIEGTAAVELECCWRNLKCKDRKTVVVNFRGVVRVDRKGRRLLKSMHQGGVRFTEARLAIQDTLEQITSADDRNDNEA